MAVNPMNNKNLSRTHSKELAKNNRGKRTRKNSDYKTTATAARQAQSQAPQKAAWPTKVKVTLGILRDGKPREVSVTLPSCACAAATSAGWPWPKLTAE